MPKKKKEPTKQERAEQALEEMNERWGDGTVVRYGSGPRLDVEAIPTGSLALDIALGVGGVPRGRVTEIYGPESSGKTTIAQHIVAEAQAQGGVCLFVDMEHALDPAYAEKCGVDMDALMISQPDTGEQGLEVTEGMIRARGADVIVVDSVAALVPKAEIEGDMGDATMGMQARLMSQALRKISGALKKSNAALIFTNQLRNKLGIVYGNPETTSGGMALKFYASARLDVRTISVHKDKSGEQIGKRVRVRVVKNKVAPPFRSAEFSIMYNEGISKLSDLLDVGASLGVIPKKGNYFVFGEDKANGRDKARAYLNERPELIAELTEKVLEAAADEQHSA